MAIAAGIAGIELMRNAGRGVAEAVARITAPGSRVFVLAGTGNNGGDGLIAAQILSDRKFRVTVGIVGQTDRIGGDARTAFDEWTGTTRAATIDLIGQSDIVVDAIFGAGLTRDVTGDAAALIDALNTTGRPVVAVDLPSGIDGATGGVRGVAVRATCTVTFFRFKPGHFLLPGRLHCGTLELTQIGIPDTVIKALAPRSCRNGPDIWRKHYPRPEETGHKYARGHAIVLSGGPANTGAARLAAHAALRSGAGLVTLASPPNALMVNAAHLTAVMLKACRGSDDLEEILQDGRIRSVVLGPALGVSENTRDLVAAALRSDAACVVDADGLTSFADDPSALFDTIGARSAETVLTPHEGEFARLFPDLRDDASKLERTHSAARRSGAIVVLKGADTVIAAPDGRTAINDNAPAFLATAGAGDVLAGILGGLCAQGMPAFEAAAAGVWMHGEAAMVCGPGMTAEDLDNGLKTVTGRLADDREGLPR